MNPSFFLQKRHNYLQNEPTFTVKHQKPGETRYQQKETIDELPKGSSIMRRTPKELSQNEKNYKLGCGVLHDIKSKPMYE